MQKLLRPVEAAKMLGLSPRTLAIRRWRKVDPPYTKLGRAVLYRQIDLEAWIKKNMQPVKKTVSSKV